MLTFKHAEPGEVPKVLMASNVKFEDGKEKEHPVKKIVITIEAGNVAHMMVERYLKHDDHTINTSAVSDDIEDGYQMTTYKNHYTVCNIDEDICIKVSGPNAKHGMFNVITSRRSSPETIETTEAKSFSDLDPFEQMAIERQDNLNVLKERDNE